jgi:hypothetical protein
MARSGATAGVGGCAITDVWGNPKPARPPRRHRTQFPFQTFIQGTSNVRPEEPTTADPGVSIGIPALPQVGLNNAHPSI